jgi:hypothetical protein
MQLYRFDVGKQLPPDASSEFAYSHAVRVNISRREAIDVMRQLLAQIEVEGEDADPIIGVTLFGELAEGSRRERLRSGD